MSESAQSEPAPAIVRATPSSVVAIALTLVLAVALVARVRYAEATPSYDEWWHLTLSVGRGTPSGLFVADRVYRDLREQASTAGAPPSWQVWTHMTGVLHPPLYCLTLRWWRDAFGDSIGVARAYSLLWSLVGAAFTFAIARQTMGLLIATLIGLALAVAPTQVYLGQEIRGYAMLFGLGAIAMWLMTRIAVIGPSRQRVVGLAAMTLPLLLTHYFAFGAVVAIALFGTARSKPHRRAFLVTLAISAGIYATVWLPFAIRQLHDIQTGDAFLHVAHREPADVAILLATAPLRTLVDAKAPVEPWSLLAGVLFYLPWLLARRLDALRPWALWLACSVGTLAVLDVARSTNHLGFTRYLTVASPAVLPLAVGCAFAVRRRSATIVSLALLALCGGALASGVWIAKDVPENAAAVHLLARYIQPGEGVIVYDGDVHDPMVSQFTLSQCLVEPGFLPRPMVTISGPMSIALARQMPTHTWLISPPIAGSIDRLVRGARLLSSADTAAGITLYSLEFDQGSP